jgi:hypothetical protein
MAHTPTPWRIATASPKFIADAEGIIVAQASVHLSFGFTNGGSRTTERMTSHEARPDARTEGA